MADQLYDLNAPVQQAQANRAGLTNLFGEQRAGTSDYLNRFKGAISGQETSQQAADRIGGELGLPGKRQAASTITNTVNNLPYTFGAATRGYDVNANQLSRIIGQKTSELTPAMNTANAAVSDAEASLDTRMGYQQADQARELLPYQTEASFLSEQNARETTGYTQQSQSELDSIIAKMNAGIQISEGEKNRANQLAMQELQYKQAIETAKMSNQGNQFVGVNSGLYNTSTGQWAVKPPLSAFG